MTLFYLFSIYEKIKASVAESWYCTKVMTLFYLPAAAEWTGYIPCNITHRTGKDAVFHSYKVIGSIWQILDVGALAHMQICIFSPFFKLKVGKEPGWKCKQGRNTNPGQEHWHPTHYELKLEVTDRFNLWQWKTLWPHAECTTKWATEAPKKLLRTLENCRNWSVFSSHHASYYTFSSD